ncbi:hypothetical protein [Pyrobaculum sp.]|uniref:hypothetical protein n=1 Tax=Pyrobaculum sp. TaxID=2004705 RepID=UPI003180EE0D
MEVVATYLPIFRIHELKYFKKNLEALKPKKAAICVDYYFADEQKPLLHDVWPKTEYILGNWRNRSSCLLRLVKYILENGGDGLIVDSDYVLSDTFPAIDKKLDLPLYHVSDHLWRHPRVRGPEVINDIEVYYWRIKKTLGRTMHLFAGPKQAIRLRGVKLSAKHLDHLIQLIDDMDPRMSGVLADEIPLGILYDKSGIREVPFVVATSHYRHKSHPKPQDNLLNKKIYSHTLYYLYKKCGYRLPALRYGISSIFYGFVP